MRLSRTNHRLLQSEVRKPQIDKDENREKNLLTPARSAALDALERELLEFQTARAG
jgi:hypothetical protein